MSRLSQVKRGPKRSVLALLPKFLLAILLKQKRKQTLKMKMKMNMKMEMKLKLILRGV